MDKTFQELTQNLAIKGLRSVSPFDNVVFSPYAITVQLFSIIPVLDSMSKGRISRFFGLKDKIKSPAEFFRLWELINLQENDCFSIYNHCWPDKDHQQKFSAMGAPFANCIPYEQPEIFLGMVNSKLDPGKQFPISFPFENLNYYKFVSLSAFSIQAAWKHQFYKGLSENSKITYHGDQGDIHSMPGLQRSAVYRSHIDADYKLLEIPFTDGIDGRSNLSLLLIAPRYRSLRDFELRFTPDFINQAIAKMIDQERAFSMPAFQIQTSFSLVDFFSTDKDLYTVFDTGFLPGLLLHQTSIKVGDSGLAPIPAELPENTYDGHAELPSSIFFYDSPFTFWVRDRATGVVFLAGRFVTP